jgi:integrase
LKRRAAGAGSLYYRADKGLWVAQHEGVYRYSKDRAVAQAKLNELLAQTEASKPANITVSTLLNQWLAFASPNLKPASIKRYKEVIRIYLKPALGHCKLSSLSAYQVQQQYSRWLASGISPNAVYRCHTILSSAFKRAAKWQLIRSNIIKDVDAPKLPHKEIEVFHQSEVQAILSAARGMQYEAAVVLALSTGARGGEIFALQPQDYDKQAGTMAIRRTLVNNGTAIGTPKSKNSRRTIHLPRIAVEALERTDLSGKWMFPSRAGTNLFYHNFLRFHWKPLCAKAGVRYRNFHTCRHYVCSTVLAQGVPIPSVAKFIGDTETHILKSYNHLMPNQMAAVAAAMDTALSE